LAELSSENAAKAQLHTFKESVRVQSEHNSGISIPSVLVPPNPVPPSQPIQLASASPKGSAALTELAYNPGLFRQH
jgi:hypothetical protein